MRGKIFLFIVLVLTLQSCKKNALFYAGDDAMEIVEIDSFEKIEIEDVFDIVLVSDSVDYVCIRCGENLMPNIEIKQEGKLIYLYNHNKYHWSREYKRVNLEIHSTQLKTIIIREPISLCTKDTFVAESIGITDWSKISIVDMTVDVGHINLGVSSDNTGEYTIKGKTNSCYFRAWGSCFYIADQLKANTCTVRHDGIGDVVVNVKDNLSVQLNTYGNVYYKGNPEINLKRSSSGSLIKIE
jgi:hypothetical protein